MDNFSYEPERCFLLVKAQVVDIFLTELQQLKKKKMTFKVTCSHYPQKSRNMCLASKSWPSGHVINPLEMSTQTFNSTISSLYCCVPKSSQALTAYCYLGRCRNNLNVSLYLLLRNTVVWIHSVDINQPMHTLLFNLPFEYSPLVVVLFPGYFVTEVYSYCLLLSFFNFFINRPKISLPSDSKTEGFSILLSCYNKTNPKFQ